MCGTDQSSQCHFNGVTPCKTNRSISLYVEAPRDSLPDRPAALHKDELMGLSYAYYITRIFCSINNSGMICSCGLGAILHCQIILIVCWWT